MIPSKNPKLKTSVILPEVLATMQVKRAQEMKTATRTFKANKLGTKAEARKVALALLHASSENPKVHSRVATMLANDPELQRSMQFAISSSPTDAKLRKEATRLGILPGQKVIITKQRAQLESASLDKAALSGIEQLPTVGDTRARKANLTELDTRAQITTLVVGTAVLQEYREGFARADKREQDLIRDAGLDQQVETELHNIDAILADARNEIYPELAAEKFELAAKLAANTSAAGQINPEPFQAVKAEAKAETFAAAKTAESVNRANETPVSDEPSALNKMLNGILDVVQTAKEVQFILNPVENFTPSGIAANVAGDAGIGLARAFTNAVVS